MASSHGVEAIAEGARSISEGARSIVEGVKAAAVGSGKKQKKDKKDKLPADDHASSTGPLEMEPPAAFLHDRLELFHKLKKTYDEEVAKKPREPIIITMPDGSIKFGTSWETTPAHIARSISNSLLKRVVVAKLDGDSTLLWDLERPLEASCKLELLTFDHPEGQQVFWHSSAHILGEACERRFGCSLCIGPPIENGFYYEMALPGGAAVHEHDWKPLESIVQSIVRERQRFERLELSKDDLLTMFSYNKYKQHIIRDKIPDGTRTTVYRNGPLIDLCRGPHVPDTSRIEAFAIMQNSSSYFLGDQKNDSLQRIYGVSFPDKKQLAEHKRILEEAALRDHRKIGRDQELFFFHELSPGSAFWLPHGARIYNTMLDYIKQQYWKRGYEEVITPNMFNAELWKTSGHWANYKDDMFTLDLSEGVTFGLKPMNCPAHCLMFSHRERSYRELPWRVADFGVLHRNEASGALTGMTRVRRFQQDDAHIFCREDQIKQEIDGLFDFLIELYGLLGFTFKLGLSTRPEKFMGDIATWDRAEAILTTCLDGFSKQPGGVSWTLNPGDGAFYGPKIDIKVFDCLNREWQCATIQLDFVQPMNFSLEYMTAHKEESDAAETSSVTDVKFLKLTDQGAQDVKAGKDVKAEKGFKAEKDVKAEQNVETDDSKAAKVRGPKPLTPGYARPVVIHRAMCGSLERFLGILCEHFAGKWPFWLSPRQVMVIPIGRGYDDYAEEVVALLRAARLFADVDLSGNTLPKKVRSAQLAQYNFIIFVGHEEKIGRLVNIRSRDDASTQDRGKPISLSEALEGLAKLRDVRGSNNPFMTTTQDAKQGQ